MKHKKDNISIAIPQNISQTFALNEIDFSIDAIEAIKRSIHALTEQEKKPKSFLTKFANFWGEIHWLTKGLILFTILTPIIIITVYLQIFTLLFISAAVSSVYIGISLLLDNHYETESSFEDSKEQRMDTLIDFFGLIVNKLWSLGNGLQKEVDEFSANNEILTAEVKCFSSENAKFKTQIELLTEKVTSFSLYVLELENIVLDLEHKAEEQESLLEKERNLQLQIQSEHEKTNSQLEAEVLKFSFITQQSQLRISQLEKIEAMLRSAVQQLAGLGTRRDTEQTLFFQKLNSILDKSQEDMIGFGLKMNNIAEKFNATLLRLNQGVKKQEELLTREDENLQILESIVHSQIKKPSVLVQRSIFKEADVPDFVKLTDASEIICVQ